MIKLTEGNIKLNIKFNEMNVSLGLRGVPQGMTGTLQLKHSWTAEPTGMEIYRKKFDTGPNVSG